MEIFPLEYGFGDFFFENGDFSFRRFVRGDFSLKIYSGDFFIENFYKDLFMEIFPLEYGFGDFSF